MTEEKPQGSQSKIDQIDTKNTLFLVKPSISPQISTSSLYNPHSIKLSSCPAPQRTFQIHNQRSNASVSLDSPVPPSTTCFIQLSKHKRMDSSSCSSLISCDTNMLISALIKGEELMSELLAQFDRPFSLEACKKLATEATSALSSAISMAKLIDPNRRRTTGLDSPLSVSNSPSNQSSNKAFREQERREMCKKRKGLPRWRSQVRASSGSSMEGGPLDDGYSWRKYGQKDIHGTKFPRGYYRCTYRHSHSCLATKQVQRNDDDGSLFDVTYRGGHTCNQHSLRKNPSFLSAEDKLEPTPEQQTHELHQQLLLEQLRAGLRVKTEDLFSEDRLLSSSPSFSFPNCTAKPHSDNNAFHSAASSNPENQFMGNYSPTFVSTTTSIESDYFSRSMSPCGLDLQDLDTEIAEIISAETSTTSSPLMLPMDFPMDHAVFDLDFPIDFP